MPALAPAPPLPTGRTCRTRSHGPDAGARRDLVVGGFVYYLNRSYTSGQLQVLLMPCGVCASHSCRSRARRSCASCSIEPGPACADRGGCRSLSCPAALIVSLGFASMLQSPNPVRVFKDLTDPPAGYGFAPRVTSLSTIHAVEAYVGTQGGSLGYFGNNGNYIHLVTGLPDLLLYDDPGMLTTSPILLRAGCAYLVAHPTTWIVVSANADWETDPTSVARTSRSTWPGSRGAHCSFEPPDAASRWAHARAAKGLATLVPQHLTRPRETPKGQVAVGRHSISDATGCRCRVSELRPFRHDRDAPQRHAGSVLRAAARLRHGARAGLARAPRDGACRRIERDLHARRHPDRDRAPRSRRRGFARRQGIRPQSAGRVQITVCRACQFVGPGFDVPESGLHRLYQDYRSAGYNEERSLYEPFYSVIAPYVGDNPVEQRERDDNLSRFLSDAIDPASISSVLDYGGDSGSHIPKVLQHCQKTVFDISDAEPVAGVTKETEVERLGTYDFIQICHTLEHVVGPRSLTAAALDHLAPGGYIYIEVPQDKTEADVQRLREAAAPPRSRSTSTSTSIRRSRWRASSSRSG